MSRGRNGHRNDCDEMIRILPGSMTFAKVLRRCVLEMIIVKNWLLGLSQQAELRISGSKPTFSPTAVKETSTKQQSQTAHKRAVIRFSLHHHLTASLFRVLVPSKPLPHSVELHDF